MIPSNQFLAFCTTNPTSYRSLSPIETFFYLLVSKKVTPMTAIIGVVEGGGGGGGGGE